MPTTPIQTEIESWYLHHGPALLLFGIALDGDRARAQDALHQVFLHLLAKPPAGIADVRTYLFSAVRHALLNGIRQRARDIQIDQSANWFHHGGNRDPVEELALRRALMALPDEQRHVVVLHIWGGLTFAQAAEVLGISPNTAGSRYRYALAKLSELLKEKHAAAPE